MTKKNFFYIFDDAVTSMEVVEVDGKFYLDEELEIQVIFDSDDSSHYASWWEGGDDAYTYVEVFSNRDDAVSSLRDSLRRRIDFLQQRLDALE